MFIWHIYKWTYINYHLRRSSVIPYKTISLLYRQWVSNTAWRKLTRSFGDCNDSRCRSRRLLRPIWRTFQSQFVLFLLQSLTNYITKTLVERSRIACWNVYFALRLSFKRKRGKSGRWEKEKFVISVVYIFYVIINTNAWESPLNTRPE